MHLNVLSVSMEHRVPHSCPCALIVSEDGGGRTLTNTQISEKASEPYTHSIVSVKAALYSASQLEVATVGCFLLNQDMHELPSMKQKPLVDTRVL